MASVRATGAYFNVETQANGAFERCEINVTSLVGYAGGSAPSSGHDVCYHSGDYRDYSALGQAEAVAITLDADRATSQLQALASDFFSSFTGADGSRARPDPMDRGRPYRSFVVSSVVPLSHNCRCRSHAEPSVLPSPHWQGLPGGTESPLYATFAKENTHGMQLKPGNGGDADAFNIVWGTPSRALSRTPPPR